MKCVISKKDLLKILKNAGEDEVEIDLFHADESNDFESIDLINNFETIEEKSAPQLRKRYGILKPEIVVSKIKVNGISIECKIKMENDL